MSTTQLHGVAWNQNGIGSQRHDSLCQWQKYRNYYKHLSRAHARQAGHEHATLTVIDLSSRLTPYTEAWDLQKQLLGALINTEDICTPAGFLILVQHTPVYTLGSGSSFEHLGFSPNDPPFPLYRTERGGEVTYHGPGQLVAYPVINLRCFNQDLHWYLRSLEEVIIRCLDEVSGLKGERVPGLTGVWVDNKKVAAIGVRAQRWVTYHGLAINVANDLQPFQLITPCGIVDRQVTTVKALLAPEDDTSRSDSSAVPKVPLTLSALNNQDNEMVSEYAHALKCAFSEVHSVKLQELCMENAASLPAAIATSLKLTRVL